MFRSLRNASSCLFALLLAVGAAGCSTAADAPSDAESGEQGATGTAVRSKDEFFQGEMYFVRVKGWDADAMTPASLVEERTTNGAELSVYKANKTSNTHCPDGEASDATLVYRTKAFSIQTSGNLTNGTPKSSYKLSLQDSDDRFFDMKTMNLKSMWNDASQMREALAWKLFGEAGVVAPRHTYAKFCVNSRYYGLYSIIEQVDKPFLKDRFGANKEGNLYKAYWRDVGPADLTYKRGPDGDDGGKQYRVAASNEERSYEQKSNDGASDDPAKQTYDDLATFVRSLHGKTAEAPNAAFESDAYRASMERVFDARGFLRWASVNALLGAWDNYWATPANYYVYNAGHAAEPKKFMSSPYFVWIPWDYDNSFGSDFFGTKWQYASIIDWESATRDYYNGAGTSNLPLVKNLLKNPTFLRYYLDHIEWMNDTFFNEAWLARTIGDETNGLRSRVERAAMLESDSPSGAAHTGRQFTNDEVYRNGFGYEELNRGKTHLEGLMHFVRMRHDSVRRQLEELRPANPRGASGATFPEETTIP